MAWLNWNDPDTYWLSVTNLVLGAVVVLCFVVMVCGVIYEVLARRARRRRMEAEIDHDMRRLLGGHAFHVSGLGITMAHGGEKRKP